MGNAQASKSKGGRGRPAHDRVEDDDPYSPPGANIDPHAGGAPLNDPLRDDRIHRHSNKQQGGHGHSRQAKAQAQTTTPSRGSAQHHPAPQQHERTNRQQHGQGSHGSRQQGTSTSRKHGDSRGSGTTSSAARKDSRHRSSSAAAANSSSTPAPIPPPPAPVDNRKSAPVPGSRSGGGAKRSSASGGGAKPPSTSQTQPTGTSAQASRQARKSSTTSAPRQSNKPRPAPAPAPAPEDAPRDLPSGKMFTRKDKMKKDQFVSAASMKASDIPQPDSSSGMSFDELYRLKEVLGTGAFSTVREGYHRRHREKMFAVKCVNRAKLTEEDAAALLDEVAILKELRHSNIIRLYDFFEEPGNYYLIMEKMTGGELFDRIVTKAYYNEKEARDTCKIILDAIGYCHKHKVAHRDLKPENLLLVSDNSDSSVKIADFGFAKKVLAPKTLTTQCGTPGYVAPEILEGTPYDTRSDMWSVGVILYILLGGYPPFIENNQRELFRKIRRGDYEFHEEYWGAVSADAKELISSLLTVNPAKRLDAQEALANKWICADDDKLEGHDLGVNLDQLRKFNAKRKFKAAVSTVMAVNKLQSLGKDFLRNLE